MSTLDFVRTCLFISLVTILLATFNFPISLNASPTNTGTESTKSTDQAQQPPKAVLGITTSTTEFQRTIDRLKSVIPSSVNGHRILDKLLSIFHMKRNKETTSVTGHPNTLLAALNTITLGTTHPPNHIRLDSKPLDTATATSDTSPLDTTTLKGLRNQDYWDPYQAETLKNIEMFFVVIRGIAGTIVLNLTLIEGTSISFWTIFPVGLTIGAMSSIFQYHNQAYLSWLSSNKWFQKNTFENAPIWKTLAKQYAVGLIINAIIRGGMEIYGTQPESTFFENKFWDAAAHTVRAASLGLFASSFWDTINSRLAKGFKTIDPANRPIIEMTSNTASFLMASLMIATQAASMTNDLTSQVIMWSLGATGLTAYLLTKPHIQELRGQIKLYNRIHDLFDKTSQEFAQLIPHRLRGLDQKGGQGCKSLSNAQTNNATTLSALLLSQSRSSRSGWGGIKRF